MERRGRISVPALYFFVAVGISLYLTILIQSAGATVLRHGLKLSGTGWVLFLAIAAAAFAALIVGIKPLARFESRLLGAGEGERIRADRTMLIPALFLLLTPLLNVHYWTREDLRARLAILGLAVIGAVLYVRLTSVIPLFKTAGGRIGRWREKIGAMPLRRKLVILFLAAFLVYNLAAFILVNEGVTFSGDEPSYLMTTDSLLHDQDINVADNYARQDWFHFYDRAEMPDMVLEHYTQEGRKGADYQYPINLPGISFLMLPWYALAGLLKGRALTFVLKGSLSVWAALLGTQIYLLVRQRFKREGLALGVWVISTFTAPIIFYATHLYPELPIALFSVYVFRKMTSDEAPTKRQILFMGFLMGTFFWFGVKYNFVFGSLILVSCHALWFRHKARARVPLLWALPVVGALVFYGAVYAMYGTISPMAVYEGIQSPERSRALMQAILAYPLSMRLDSFFDYFLDQRDGLLLYAPVYLFALLGIVPAWRRRRSDVGYAALIALPFLLNYAFFTHRQGVSPQGRVMAPMIWIGALMLAHFIAGTRNRVFRAAFGIGATASVAIAVLMHFHPDFLYQTTTHEVTERAGAFFVYLSNMRFFWPPFLPSFLKFPVQDYPPNTIWIAGVAALAVLYAIFGMGSRLQNSIFRRKSARFTKIGSNKLNFVDATPITKRTHLVMACVMLAGVFWMWCWQPRTVLYPTWTSDYPVKTKLGFYLNASGNAVVTRENGRFYLHEVRPHRFVFASEKKLDRLKIAYGSETEDFETRIRFFDLPLTEGRTSKEIREFDFEPKASYVFRGRYIYEIGIDIARLSPKKEVVEPYFFQIAPGSLTAH